MKIIETNICYDEDRYMKDHQSRIVEVPTWEEYVSIFDHYDGTGKGKEFKSSMYGYVLLNNRQLMNLKYDDHHLSCQLIAPNGMREMKLAYLVR